MPRWLGGLWLELASVGRSWAFGGPLAELLLGEPSSHACLYYLGPAARAGLPCDRVHEEELDVIVELPGDTTVDVDGVGPGQAVGTTLHERCHSSGPPVQPSREPGAGLSTCLSLAALRLAQLIRQALVTVPSTTSHSCWLALSQGQVHSLWE